MSLDRAWKLISFWKNDTIITLVKFEITYTDETYPGISRIHAGSLDLSNRNFAHNTDKTTLLAACQTAMSSFLPNIDAFYATELKNAYMQEASTEIFSSDRVITEDDIIQERLRRLAVGFDYDFGDSRGIHHIGTTARDLAGWDEVTKIANALINLGQGSTLIGIKTDTGPTEVSANEWQAILIASANFRQPIFMASFNLQAMSPYPQNYTDNSYWE